MKKISSCLFFHLSILLILSFPQPAYSQGVHIQMEDMPVQRQSLSFFYGKELFLPLESLQKELQFEFKSKNHGTEFHLIHKRSKSYYVFFINQSEYIVNGKKKQMDCPVFIEYNKIYVPLKSFSKALDYKIHWDLSSHTFIIVEKPLPKPKFFQTFDLKTYGTANQIPVFMYHHLLPEAEIKSQGQAFNAAIVSVEQFEEEINFLYENHFYTACLDEVQDFLRGKIQLPKRTVVLTFDDGYLSNLEYAYPIMKKHHFCGTIFSIGHRAVGDPEPFSPKKYQFIKNTQFRDYEDVFDFESHTYNLHRLNGENISFLTLASADEIVDDLNIHRSFTHNKYLAYPFGQYNQKVKNALKEANYKLAFTTQAGYTKQSADPYALPRFPVYSTMTIEEFQNIIFGNWIP